MALGRLINPEREQEKVEAASEDMTLFGIGYDVKLTNESTALLTLVTTCIIR